MSIVEKALKKLWANGQPPPRAAGIAAADALVAPVPPQQPRIPIGNLAKTVRVDYDALRRDGLLPPEHQQRELAHQYRTLKRPLLKHAFQSGAKAGGPGVASPRSIMVSSALPGDGKTFTSINLALSLSLEKDHGVLLVDGDIPKPHVSETFGVAEEPGLLDVLADPNLAIESVVLPTDVQGLSILPVGRRSESATELLSSARMRQIITRLEQLDPQGLVVVDSPPILLTSEARVLASLFGQVVLVVRASTTPQQAVLDAIEIIGEGPRVGLILNQAAHESSIGGYYGYGYGYGNANASDRNPSGRALSMVAATDNT